MRVGPQGSPSAVPVAIFVLGYLILASGCSGGGPDAENSDSGQVFSLPGGVNLLVSGPVDGASDSNVPGTVAVVRDCLGVEIGDNSYVVVWPAGTTAGDGEEPGLVLPDGVEVTLGSEIEGAAASTPRPICRRQRSSFRAPARRSSKLQSSRLSTCCRSGFLIPVREQQ